MAKVTMHKANDGSLHEKAKDCEARNVTLRMMPALVELAQKAREGSDIVVNDEEGNRCIYLDDLPAYIAANADALRKILNDSRVARRTRKLTVVKTSAQPEQLAA